MAQVNEPAGASNLSSNVPVSSSTSGGDGETASGETTAGGGSTGSGNTGSEGGSASTAASAAGATSSGSSSESTSADSAATTAPEEPVVQDPEPDPIVTTEADDDVNILQPITEPEV